MCHYAAHDMSAIAEELNLALAGRHPLIYFCTHEESRAEAALRNAAPSVSPTATVSVWTCVDGLDGDATAETRDPVGAIRAILRSPHDGFYLMKDLSAFMGRPDVVRALRDAYYTLRGRGRAHLVIVSPDLVVPDALDKEVYQVELSLPGSDEMLAQIARVESEHPGMRLPPERLSEIALALRGLTLEEAGHVLHRILGSGRTGEKDVLDEIFSEKKSLLRKAGYLEFVPNRLDMDNVGGLEVLKEWAIKRRDLFTKTSLDAGLPVPKGVLVMGISGCGKSMCAKAIAALWRVPLFRLDMNMVFSGLYGTPEAAFHKALKAIESVAPAVMWIDEIENALGMTVDSNTTEQQLTFSSFLTWMQERPPLVFVAATANRIESLPAEVIRKGRFDEVFFCDLPREDERREIIRIHLRLNGAEPDTMNVDRLLNSTEGWTGAEIEQAVIAGRIDAHREGRGLTIEDVRHHTIRMVPLSQTMAEQISAIRNWAYKRALRASLERQRTMVPGR
jgi:hypothetical protein